MRLSLLGAGGLLVLLSGCTEASGASTSAPLAAPTVHAAAAAGGACRLLDFDVIEQHLGVRFEVAAARTQRQTTSCVVQPMKASRPDLALSVSPTTADADIFRDMVEPDDATAVKGVGKAAYRLSVAGGKGYGPGVEVGWLTADGRLVTMRYTAAAGANRKTVDALAPRLVALAKIVEATKA